MKILIAGIGDLGSEVARRLVAAGHDVVGLRRSDRRLPDGVEPLRGDVGEPSSLALPKDLDAIVYAVAADGRTDESYARAYPRGLANVLDAIDPSAPDSTRVVFVSSTGVYGQDDGSTVDEDSPTEPASFTGARMVEAERVLAASRFRGTSLRLGGIYGPGRTFLIESVRSRRATYAPGSTQWTNRIHRDDAARAIEHVLSLDAPPGVLNVVDRGAAPRREVLEWLAERLGAPAPRASEASERRSGPTDKRVSSDRLVATGFEHRYPTYREGYAAVLGDPA